MPSTLFSQSWAELAGAVVVGLLWQGAIIGALVAFALPMTRKRSPNLRYALACAGLLVIAVLLPANFLVLRNDTLASAPEPVPTAPSSATNAQVSPGASAVSSIPSIPVHTVHKTDPPTRPRLTVTQWYHRCLPWVGRLWAAGILCFALYDLAGLFALRRLRAKSTAVGEDIAALARRVQERLGVRVRVQIRWLAGISSALVTGFFRTVILLPASMATRMTPDEIEAILAHEFAHIRRWDLWVNAFQRVVEALLFFHPVVWWLSKTIRHERERCCDELALQVYPDRARYVRALLTLAETPQPTETYALASHGGSLVHRVRGILSGPNERGHVMQGRTFASIVALATVAMPLLIACFTSLTGAAVLPERDLYFPEDQSVGAVQGRWVKEDYREVPWRPDHNAGWTQLSAARGLVSVPADALVKLTVAGTDLRFLDALDPDAVYFLDCRFQKLTNDDAAPIAAMTGLRALDLSDNPNLTGEVLGTLAGLQDLEWLDFDRSPIDGLPPGALRQFPNLRYVAGHFGVYADDVLHDLGELPNIEFISIKAGTVTPEGLRALSGNRTLRGLVLDNVELSDETLAALNAVPQLVYLDLRKNPNLTDRGLAHLSAMPGLTHLNLEYCSISDEGVAVLAANRKLEDLSLANTPVTEACLNALLAMPALRSVKLVETGVAEGQAAALTAQLATRAGYDVPAQQSSNPDAPKVGIVMSHFTATGPHWIQRPYGYSVQVSREAARALDQANFDVYAVIEPGTEFMGELPGILRENGLTNKIINGYEPESIEQLDVVFSVTVYNAQVEMLEALSVAVQNGVGMVNVGSLGTVNPGNDHPAVERLTGLTNGSMGWMGFQDAHCPVVSAHPILGNIDLGSVITVNPLDGARGEFDTSQDHTVLCAAPADFPQDFPCLYVLNHGQGRIVRAQWHRPLQPGIPFPGYTFYIRALNWAAHRDVDAVW